MARTSHISLFNSDFKRFWFQNQAEVKVPWVTWFDDIASLWWQNEKLLHDGGRKYEESLARQVLAQARASSPAEGNEAGRETRRPFEHPSNKTSSVVFANSTCSFPTCHNCPIGDTELWSLVIDSQGFFVCAADLAIGALQARKGKLVTAKSPF